MKRIALLLLFIYQTANSVNAQTDYGFPVQTTITNGTIEGRYDTKEGLQIYLGVPFAKPPVGPLRWKAPQPLDNWKGIKMTTKFGPRPIQGIVFGDMHSLSDGLSEDCLYLNVWTPARFNKKDMPVLVYFYGGGFVAGDGSEPRYNGASMAKKGMVVITVNYRLGIFGFFAHPELSAETTYKGSGNYGLLDQYAALKWVQQNVARFGGDPKRVTIAGESAGSISVSAQMASPLSKGLIAGAIGESGASINPTLAPVPMAEAEKQGLEFAKNAGAASIAAMRAMSTYELFEKYQDSKRFGFPIAIDGYFFSKNVTDIFNAREQAMVPLLLGWNSAEIPGSAFMQGQPYKEDNYVSRMKTEYPKDWEEMLRLYPHSSDKEIELSATALSSDRFIAYSTWKWFDLHRKNSNKPVYRYLYSKIMPPMVDATLTPGLAGGSNKNTNPGFKMPEPVGAPHACEIEYCMGNLSLNKERAWTEDDFKVSATMQNYFANFIINGNPNGKDLPNWPAAEANSSEPAVMILNTASGAIKAKDDARYLLLDKLYKNN